MAEADFLRRYEAVLQLQKELAARGLISPPVAAGHPVTESSNYDFYDLSFRVSRNVFKPHALSARVVDLLVQFTADIPAPVVADVGTGCGALAIAFARQRGTAVVYATDVSVEAVGCARHNAIALKADNVEVLSGSLLEPLIKRGVRLDALIANLPWVAPAILEVLNLSEPPNWRGPRTSVAGVGRDGLDLIRTVLRDAASILKPNSLVLVGMDDWQMPIITEEFAGSYERTADAVPYFLTLRPRPAAESPPAP